jgi:hypothetical protein
VIYFTRNTRDKAIKIGYSKNPKKRRGGLQSASSAPLVLLGAIHGGLDNGSRSRAGLALKWACP